MARTADRITARERARAARTALDAARERRDTQIEEAAAQFFEASDEIDEVRRSLDALDERRRDAVAALVGLKEPPARIVALLGIDSAEYRRLSPGRTTRATPPEAAPAP